MIGWVWKICGMALGSGKVPGSFKDAGIIPLYKGEG